MYECDFVERDLSTCSATIDVSHLNDYQRITHSKKNGWGIYPGNMVRCPDHLPNENKERRKNS